MLTGEEGPAIRKSMKILTALGDIYDSDGLIPIHSAHISGISLKTGGEAALKFVENLASEGAEVRSHTTINPGCVDLENWKKFNVSEDLVKKQQRMIEAYKKIGADPTCSCTPYLIGNRPPCGRHLAWSESSASVFANSVLGARTNREGSPSALASAITGLTPRYGYHLDRNRKGSVTIIPDGKLLGEDETWPYSVFGYWVGKKFPNSVPVIEGIRPNSDQLKAMGAAMGTSGAIALYHVPNLTPEAVRNPSLCKTEESVTFGLEEFEGVVAELDQTSEAELICLGCPHCSLDELRGLPKVSQKEVWVCLSRKLKKEADRKGITRRLVKYGIRIVCDTCMVVAPLPEMGYSSIGVNSAKAAHYLQSLTEIKVHFKPIRELLG